MNKQLKSGADKALIARLQSQLDELRQREEISERGELLFREYLNSVDDDLVVVEADGLGGAILRVVQGNYPMDYVIREERIFSTETEAEEAACSLCDH